MAFCPWNIPGFDAEIGRVRMALATHWLGQAQLHGYDRSQYSFTTFAGRVFVFQHGLFAQMTGVEKVVGFDCRPMGPASPSAGDFRNLIWWDRCPERSC